MTGIMLAQLVELQEFDVGSGPRRKVKVIWSWSEHECLLGIEGRVPRRQ